MTPLVHLQHPVHTLLFQKMTAGIFFTRCCHGGVGNAWQLGSAPGYTIHTFSSCSPYKHTAFPPLPQDPPESCPTGGFGSAEHRDLPLLHQNPKCCQLMLQPCLFLHLPDSPLQCSGLSQGSSQELGFEALEGSGPAAFCFCGAVFLLK